MPLERCQHLSQGRRHDRICDCRHNLLLIEPAVHEGDRASLARTILRGGDVAYICPSMVRQGDPIPFSQWLPEDWMPSSTSHP